MKHEWSERHILELIARAGNSAGHLKSAQVQAPFDIKNPFLFTYTGNDSPKRFNVGLRNKEQGLPSSIVSKIFSFDFDQWGNLSFDSLIRMPDNISLYYTAYSSLEIPVYLAGYETDNGYVCNASLASFTLKCTTEDGSPRGYLSLGFGSSKPAYGLQQAGILTSEWEHMKASYIFNQSFLGSVREITGDLPQYMAFDRLNPELKDGTYGVDILYCTASKGSGGYLGMQVCVGGIPFYDTIRIV